MSHKRIAIIQKSLAKKSSMKMMLTKRKDYIKNFTDVRFFVALNKLKLPNLGRIENIIRISDSDLSWQEKIKWAERISNYQGKRNETIDYYTILYNSEKIAMEKMKEKSDRISGEKNPWFVHGGKYSPFSKGSINYSEDAIIKANENREYNTRIEYYLKKGMGLCQAISARKERQATGKLERYLQRYGDEDGISKWKERQKRWQNTLLSKPEEERARIQSSRIGKGYSVSKAEKELFYILSKTFDVSRSLALSYNNEKKLLCI